MPTQVVAKLIPVLLGATLFALACEKPPNPAAPRPPSFGASNGNVDRITGGGKLGDGRDFATFGFNARPDQGQIEWVQHCLDGVNPNPLSTCSLGGFTFHGSTVSGYGFAPPPLDDPTRCRAWTGVGDANFKDLGTTGTFTFSAKACDFGEPGRGTDTICFTFSGYVREGTLAGGNVQLHADTPPPSSATCPSEAPPV